MKYLLKYGLLGLAAGFAVLVTGLPLEAQKIADGTYWIYFTDKKDNGYDPASPMEFLTERSVNRRAWQGLPVDITDEPVTRSYLDEIRAMGIRIKHVSRWLNGIAMVDLSDSLFQEVVQKPFADTLPWIPDLSDNGGLGPPYFPPRPEGSRFSPPLETPPDYDYGIAREQIRQLDMDYLHHEGYTGKGVWIGLLDASFRNVDSLPSFESMIAEGRLLGTRNFVSDSSVFRTAGNHGMYVLSICGAESDGNMVGTAPGASYFLCTTENIFHETKIEEIAWIEGAEFLDSLGIDVINTSLGYSDFDGESFDYTYEDMDGRTTYVSRAASMCASKGIVTCISAGNEGNKSWYRITAPSDALDILSVGAVDSTGHIALFSSRGPTYDGRLNPSVVAMGLWTGIQSSLGGFTRGNGTSFSAPLMTGASASLWQVYPETPARELIYRIRESGKRNANPDATYGYGIPSFKTAGWLISGTGPVPALAETLHIFPNPSTGRFTVSLPGNPAGVFRILITDMNGRQVMTRSTSLPGEVVLPPGMPAGIYILEAESGQGIYRSLFMKE